MAIIDSYQTSTSWPKVCNRPVGFFGCSLVDALTVLPQQSVYTLDDNITGVQCTVKVASRITDVGRISSHRWLSPSPCSGWSEIGWCYWFFPIEATKRRYWSERASRMQRQDCVRNQISEHDNHRWMTSLVRRFVEWRENFCCSNQHGEIDVMKAIRCSQINARWKQCCRPAKFLSK